MRLHRALLSVALSALVVVPTVGCADSDTPKPTGAAAHSAPRPAPAALTYAQANSVPLEITERQLLRRVGRPSSTISRGPGGSQSCLLYRQAGARPTDRWQFCFERGRLVVVASYYAKTPRSRP